MKPEYERSVGFMESMNHNEKKRLVLSSIIKYSHTYIFIYICTSNKDSAVDVIIVPC